MSDIDVPVPPRALPKALEHLAHRAALVAYGLAVRVIRWHCRDGCDLCHRALMRELAD